jgi:hypothetical protein
MNPFNKSLALAAALLAATVTGCSSGAKSGGGESVPTGSAKIAVSSKLSQDINHLTLTVSGTGITDRVLELTPSDVVTKKQWNGTLSQLPAGLLTFKAAAYNAAGTALANRIYYGEAQATIVAGAQATVNILLQEDHPQGGPTRYSPQITALTLSNSFVAPGTPVTISAKAVDPDHLGEPLHYAISATCSAGTLESFTLSSADPAATGTPPHFDFDTVFTAPKNFTGTSVCSIALQVSETTGSDKLSVTDYFTIVVNNNFGSASVSAFPNTYPIVSVQAGFKYNYWAGVIDPVTGLPVALGQSGAFTFDVTDSDSDDVQFDVAAVCSGTAVAASSWSPGVTYTHATPAQWTPAFGPYQPTDSDCVFTLTVHDLCTGGNCGDAAQNGQFKSYTIAGTTTKVVSSTTAIINATHQPRSQHAPVVENFSTPNQDLVNGQAAKNVATWDPQKKAWVESSTAYNLQAAADTRFDVAPATGMNVSWSCNTGSVSAATNSVGTYNDGTLPAAVANLTSSVAFTTGAAVPPDAQCTATFTSIETGLATVVTFQFLKKDPCAVAGQNGGEGCSSGNLCKTGETCQADFTCGGGSAVPAPTYDAQCQSVACAPSTGWVKTDLSAATLCDADSNGCSQNDHCNGTGACVAGASVTCSQSANVCLASSGSCSTGGSLGNGGVANNNYSCTYAAQPAATACDADGSGCTQNDHCDGVGACVAGPSATCSQSLNPCQQSTGSCSNGGALGAGGQANNTYGCSFANMADTTGCNVAGTCVTGQTCLAGSCQGGTAACAAGLGCAPTTPSPTCYATIPVPHVTRDLFVTPPAGLGMDAAGNTYVTANFTMNSPTSFGGVSLTSTGGNDIFVGKYDTAGNVVWALDIGDDDGVSATDQKASGAAVNQNGTVAIAGNVAGAVTFGTSPTISSASGIPFVGALDSAGNKLWAKGFDLGSSAGFSRIAANPNSGRIAVCGLATKLAPAALLVGQTGQAYGGLQDAIVAVLNNDGSVLWGRQFSSAGNELCNALAVDDNGDVFAAGQFDGATLNIGGTVLTGPGTTARKFLWVAKLNGATGATLQAVSYNGASGAILPQVATTDASGDLFVAGNFSGASPNGPMFGSTQLNSVGSDDAFIVKLDRSTLVPVISPVRIGSNGADVIKGLAVTSFGDVIATGTIAGSATATSGIATLSTTGTASPDQLVLKLNGQTLGADYANLFGDSGTQNGDAVVVNRWGTGGAMNAITIGGTLTGTADFNKLPAIPAAAGLFGRGGTAGSVTAGNAIDEGLVFGSLQ